MNYDYDASLKEWREKEKAAYDLLKIVGELRFDRSIELILFRRDIYDSRASQVLNDHLFAKNYVKTPISVHTSLAIAKAIYSLEDLAPCRLDIGRIAMEWVQSGESEEILPDFVADKLKEFTGDEAVKSKTIVPKDVVLYGFGRIGRLAARRLIGMTGRGEQLRLKAIVIRPKLDDRNQELRRRASLFRKDSVHGKFRGTISVAKGQEAFMINGNLVQVIFAKGPAEIDYTKYGINEAIVIDNTGVWRDKESLSQHLRPGASQVLFTAPGKGIKNIVHGVNHKTLNFKEDNVLCAASCTTNAIVPVLKIIHDNYNILNGHVESIHAYTNAQNLLDNFNKKERRGRAAAVNMVITSTGAATAVGKVIEDLNGKLTGSAIRVPTPDGSLAIMTLNLEEATSVEALNAKMHEASLSGELVEQIHYSTSKEFVSSDVIGTTAASVFDAPSTKVSPDGKTLTVYVWYDNEFGYTCQVLRLAKYITQVRRYRYY